MAIVGNIASEVGDIIRIKTDIPIIGIVSLYSFVDDVTGETGIKYFDKSFRYSVDGGLNFTTWFELTTINIQSIVVKRKDQFIIDYKYVRTGTDSTGDLSFNQLTLSGDFQELPYPVYTRSVFNLFFDVNDVNVLGWSLNVLEKLYNRGIIPDYITRKWEEINPISSDADFIAFFNSFTHFFAIIVYYARQYGDIANNNILLSKFLESLGLYLNQNISEPHLQYLFANYTTEFRKRGTSAIVSLGDNNTPNGELLRLINYVFPNEFIFALLEPHATGWCLGKSSPSYNSTRQCENMIKGYEMYNGFKDIAKYPVSPNSSVLSVDPPSTLTIIEGMPNTITGIYPLAFDPTKAINVSQTENYEVIIKIRQDGSDLQLNFGCKFYDIDGVELLGYNLLSKTDSNFFFSSQRLPLSNHDYLISGILFNVNTDPNIGDINDLSLNIGYGGHLKIPKGTTYVMPFFYNYLASSTTGAVTFTDFKIRPLHFNFTLGKLGLKRILYLLYENSSIYKEDYIARETREKLIPLSLSLIDNNVLFTDYWILATGFWDDEGIWIPSEVWID
jgi:hypothetical protein